MAAAPPAASSSAPARPSAALAAAGSGGLGASGEDAASQQPRERLDLDDFEIASGAAFDPVNWLNARLARSAVPYDKLDQHLTSLAMRCQLLCQDTSESIEVASNQLVTQLPSTGRDLERMRDHAVSGHGRLGRVLEGLRDADDRKQSGLQGLAEIDAVKTRVETAYSALKEVGSWDRKVRDCEQLVHSGKLPAALTQLTSLKGVLNAFRMLPEYGKKEAQLQQLEEHLLTTARRRARQAVERNVVADLAACSEAFAAMDRPQELSSIAEAVFAEVASEAWRGKEPRGGAGASAGELAAATKSVLGATAQAFRERWPLLQSLDEAAASASDAGDLMSAAPSGSPREALPAASARAGATTAASGGPGSADGGATTVTAATVRAALGVLSSKLEPCLAAQTGSVADMDASAKEELAHLRASRAVALLAEYDEGLGSLAQVTPMAESPTLWAETCRDLVAASSSPGASGAEALPWALLKEIATHVILRPMQDDALALMLPTQGQSRLAEEVSAAESNARKLMQMPASWARYLEDKGCARLAAVWLACVDATAEAFWRQWDSLVGAFQKAIPSQGASPPSGYDPSMLSECMQLHMLLHGLMTSQFATFQTQALQHAARLRSGAAASTALGTAIAEKLREGEPGSTWFERLATPSAEALRGASAALENLQPDSPALAMKASKALPASTFALAEVEKQARSLVTRCCAQPAAALLATYSEMPEWAKDVGSDSMALLGGLSPLPCITAVGEHLFALMPQLEQSHHDGGGGGAEQVQWLPSILDSVVETAMQKVMQIRQLSPSGAKQLITDLEYLHKVTDALGSGAASHASPSGAGAVGEHPAAAVRLEETLSTLTFLAEQQRRQRECAAKGEAFVEAPRDGTAGTGAAAPAARRAERALRAALGVGGGAPASAAPSPTPPPPPSPPAGTP